MKVVLRAGIALAGLVSAATMASAGSSLKDIDITTKSISQDSENSSPVTNIGTISSNGEMGTGASASVTATGAASSASYSSVGVTGPAIDLRIGWHTPGNAISQTSNNGGANVTNTDDIITTKSGASDGTLVGDGASATAAATGAAASVSFSKVDVSTIGGRGRGRDRFTVGNVDQKADDGASLITNSGVITVGALHGDGTSLSIGATGAVASLSASSVNSSGDKIRLGNVHQDVVNDFSPVSNVGIVNAGDLSGNGSAASVSATGAVAAISFSNVGSGGDRVRAGNVSQSVRNTDSPVNNNVNNNSNVTISAGNLSGNGSSTSVGGTGAVASIAAGSINSGASSLRTGDITQSATNEGLFGGSSVTNYGSINVGDLTGTGASASISASGAVASISVSNINTAIGTVRMGNITQTASNSHSSVNNVGTITLGSLAGSGASASISATGAASVVSFSSIAAK